VTIKRKWGETFDDAFDRVVAEQDRAREITDARRCTWSTRIRNTIKRRKTR
jgi:hypothetical protein